MENELDVRYNNILISGRKDETLTYSKYVKDKSSGRGLDEIVDDKVSKTDQLTTSQLADGSVTTEKIAQGAVNTEQIGHDAIRSENINDGAVTTDKLFDNCVQTKKLEDYSVTMEKLADGSVVNKKLAPGAVSVSKIADQAVSVSKIADEVWDKMEGDYLRRDGENYMRGNLDMAGNTITGAYRVANGPNSIFLGQDGYVMEVGNESTYGGFKNGGDFEVLRGDATANGFKTKDRTNIGLIANDGSVGLPLTDTEIDAVIAEVFNYVIG